MSPVSMAARVRVGRRVPTAAARRASLARGGFEGWSLGSGLVSVESWAGRVQSGTHLLSPLGHHSARQPTSVTLRGVQDHSLLCRHLWGSGCLAVFRELLAQAACLTTAWEAAQVPGLGPLGLCTALPCFWRSERHRVMNAGRGGWRAMEIASASAPGMAAGQGQ